MGGVSVAAADINSDGLADVIVGAGPGGGPHDKLFGGQDGSLLQNFLAYAPGFVGGVQVSFTDTNGDGRPDLVIQPGSGSSSLPGQVLDALTLNVLDQLFLTGIP